MLPIQIHLNHFNISSLINLLVILMFFSGSALGCMSIYKKYLHNQVLHLGSNTLPQCGSPDVFTSMLPVTFSIAVTILTGHLT